MNPRQWLPEVALDEVIPATADRPDDFLSGNMDGTWYVRPRDGDDENRNAFEIPVAHGDVVPFCFSEVYGTISVTIDEAGGFIVDGAYPPHTNCFHCDALEEVFESIEKLAITVAHDDSMDVGTLEVEAYYWSEKIDFRFELIKGVLQLVPVDGLPLDDESRR